MKTLIIHQTDDSPEILFDRDKPQFIISGKSLPEDASSFYAPVLQWLEEYKSNPLQETVISFKFTYFNTASSKMILDLLILLEDLNEKGQTVKVQWYYPEYDEDMKDAGIEYSEMVEVPFEHIRHNP